MLAESVSNFDRDAYLQMQDAELRHFQQQYSSEMMSYDIAPEGVKGALDQMQVKLIESRKRLDELAAASEAEWPKRLASYREARNDIRDTFKRIDKQHDTGGPPLD